MDNALWKTLPAMELEVSSLASSAPAGEGREGIFRQSSGFIRRSSWMSTVFWFDW